MQHGYAQQKEPSSRHTAASMRIRPTDARDSPLSAFVLMDGTEAQKLVHIVSQDLGSIKKVCSGTGLSTPDLQLVGALLTKGEVPDSWSDLWPSCPEEPQHFLQGLSKRVSALKSDWLLNRVAQQAGGPDATIGKPVRLADFLNPDIFMNALRQQTARKSRVAMDSLVLVSSFQGMEGLSQQVAVFRRVAIMSQKEVSRGLSVLEGCVIAPHDALFIMNDPTIQIIHQDQRGGPRVQ